MKGYAEYKDSAVPWLVQLPAHWNIVRAKQIFKSIDERSKTGNEELLSVSSSNGVVKRDETNVTMFKAESYVGYKLCWPEDLVINSLWAWQYGLGFSNDHGIISTAYSVFRIKDNSLYNYKFFDYFVRSTNFHWELMTRSKGIWKSRYQLSDEDFLSSPIIVPTRKEQDEIVRFLDNKLAKIDRLISIKQKQIELLKDRKTRIIDKSLTYGIEGNVKVKDSGINWLGKVNLNWEIVTLKDILSSGLKYGANESAQTNNKSYPRYIRITDIDNNGKLKDTFVSLPTEIAKKYILKKGDILFARSGATVGKAFLYEESYGVCCYAGYLIKASVNINLVNPKFLIYYTQSSLYNSWVNMINIQATIQNISAAKYRDLAIPLPPIEVQDNIVHYLDGKIAKMRYVEGKINSSIELLNEYRIRLISDAVTGVIDASNWKSKDTNKD